MRLGRNKISETINSETLLQRVISCLSLFEGEIIIVKAREQPLPQLKKYTNLKAVDDIYPERGPLGGIYTGLASSSSFVNLVVAGDMPFLNRALLRYMIKLSDGFDVVVPRLGKFLEPLHAVYSKSCLAPIESFLKQDNLMVARLFDFLKVRYVEAEEIDRFDPGHLSFFNINTEDDLKTARKIDKEEKRHDNC